jgi:NADH-quinone oxidoreductase subunit K
MMTTFFIVAIALMLLTGIYSLVVSRNLIRVLISLEVLTKSATLAIILAGYLNREMGLAQAFAITLTVIEVVVIAIAAGIIIGIYKHTGSLDTKNIKNLKG